MADYYSTGLTVNNITRIFEVKRRMVENRPYMPNKIGNYYIYERPLQAATTNCT